MISLFLKYLEDSELGSSGPNIIRIIFYCVIPLICLRFFFKSAFKQRNYLEIYPTRKFGFFNVLGSMWDFLLFAKVKGIPINVYMLQALMGYYELFKLENFFYVRASYSSFLIITKAKAVEELISGTKNLEKHAFYNWLHPWLGSGLLVSHGSKWKSRRKLVTPAFHFDILRDFLPIMNEQSHLLAQLLQKETDKPWTDVIKPVTFCALDIICETTFGVSIGAQKNSELEYVGALSRVTQTIMKRVCYPPYHLDWYFYITPTGYQFRKDVKALHGFTNAVIANKKAELLNSSQKIVEDFLPKKRKSLMDVLLEEHMKNESLTEKELREELDVFAFGGHDTVAAAITWQLYLIGLYKHIQEKLHEEIDLVFGDDDERPVTIDDLKDFEYLDRVLKESQRLFPPVPMPGRVLSEDTLICGVPVSKDVGIMIFAYALHRDETVFPNPEKFDPDRFLPENTCKRSPFAYIPFSAGPRNCIGQRFAVMEMKVVVINILRKYTLESLDPRDKVLPSSNIVLAVTGPMRIKIRPRRP